MKAANGVFFTKMGFIAYINKDCKHACGDIAQKIERRIQPGPNLIILWMNVCLHQCDCFRQQAHEFFMLSGLTRICEMYVHACVKVYCFQTCVCVCACVCVCTFSFYRLRYEQGRPAGIWAVCKLGETPLRSR